MAICAAGELVAGKGAGDCGLLELGLHDMLGISRLDGDLAAEGAPLVGGTLRRGRRTMG